MEEKKYYWLRLKRDFFKRHDIKIVEQMPNGKDYILFYLKLLCESVDHEGNLRFSDEIPYNDEMLSIITDTNIDIVRSAIQVFSKLDMIEVFDDGTLYMRGIEKMIGCETEWAEKKRKYRASLKKEDNVLALSDKSNSKSNSNSKSIEKDIHNKHPNVTEVKAYILEKGYHFSAEEFVAFYESNGWKVGKNPMKSWKAACVTWESNYKKKQPNKGKSWLEVAADLERKIGDER